MHNDNIMVILFCEIIINRGVLIFVDFVVHVKLNNQNPTKFNLPIDLPILLETMNSKTQGSLHFLEITNTGANEHRYFHVI